MAGIRRRRQNYKRFLEDEFVEIPRRTRRRRAEAEDPSDGDSENNDEDVIVFGDDNQVEDVFENFDVFLEEHPHADEAGVDDDDSDTTDEDGDIIEDQDENTHRLKLANGDQLVSSEGSDMKKFDSLLTVLSYAVKHHISGVALQDLIELINLHCPGTLPSSKYLFGNSLTGYKGVCEFYFYCSCKEYLGDVRSVPDICNKCGQGFDKDESMKKGRFFIVLPLRHQLKHLMESKGLGTVLINRDLTTNDDYISDIKDGLLYKKLVEDGLLSDKNNMSLMWNTDGIPVFKSSKSSIWPVLCSINELPVKMRMENVILTALWFGPEKPNMNVFLKPFVKECNMLSSTGFQWKLGNENKVSLVFCLVCTVDTVARPMLQQMMQFNGFYGCGFCKHKGEYVTNCVKYPDVHPPPVLRSEQQTKQESILAEESGRTIDGVKGVSILSFLTYFNIITSFVPDYMHAVCLGTVRRFVGMWLNSAHRNQDWYIGNLSKELCTRLKFVQVTNEMTRLPRSLTEMRFWKANEWRSFLFYSPAILKGLLPRKYLAHWSMLVCAIFHLNSEKISQHMLQHCNFLLRKFVLFIEPLYGKQQATFNVHLLTHMCDSVRNWGPLWGTSAFMFESYNGYLKKLFAGTRCLPQQIFQSICRMQDVFRYASGIHSPEAAFYVAKMVDGHRFIKNARKFASDNASVVCLGGPKLLLLTQVYRNVIENLLRQNLEIDTVECFDRFIMKHVLLSSRNYSNKFRRNNSIIDIEGILGEILYLISFKNHGCIGICNCPKNVLLLVQKLDVVESFKCQQGPELGCTVGFIRAVTRGNYVALNIDVNFSKAMLVSVGDTEYVITLPNAVEGD